MTRRRRDPGQKKVLSYLKDTRSNFSKNNKTGRKAVRVRKADDHRSCRKAVHQLLIDSSADPEGTQAKVAAVARKPWRKRQDPRLLLYLDHTWSGSSRTEAGQKYKDSQLRKMAKLKLRKKRGQFG